MEANRILVVEDDRDIREGIEIYLRNQGYVVFQAGDGVEGLEIIRREKIHLAIVDIMMPRMDGITMMMKVRDKGYVSLLSCFQPNLKRLIKSWG